MCKKEEKQEPTPSQKAKKTKFLKGVFSKFIVLLVITMNILFATEVFAVFRATGSEPSTLITAWFAFTTGELWFLSGLTKVSRKRGSDE